MALPSLQRPPALRNKYPARESALRRFLSEIPQSRASPIQQTPSSTLPLDKERPLLRQEKSAKFPTAQTVRAPLPVSSPRKNPGRASVKLAALFQREELDGVASGGWKIMVGRWAAPVCGSPSEPGGPSVATLRIPRVTQCYAATRGGSRPGRGDRAQPGPGRVVQRPRSVAESPPIGPACGRRPTPRP